MGSLKKLKIELTYDPSIPVLGAHILGVKGTVAATAELVAALGAVKVHAASSGQCVRELALGAVCKGQQVRVGAAPQAPGRVSFYAMRDYWAPYLYRFPEGTSPSPGLGILGHWCVSSSGNLHSSGLGAAPPTARRKQASHESSMPGPSCWPPHSIQRALTQCTALPSTLCSNTKLQGQPWFSHLFTPDTFTSKSHFCHSSPAPLFFIPTLTTFTPGQVRSRLDCLP